MPENEPSKNPDAIPEHNPNSGPPPLSDTGVQEFADFWYQAMGGNIASEEIVSRFFYFAPRLLRRIIEGDLKPPVVDIPPPGSQGAAEMNVARTLEIVDHPLVGKYVTMHYGSGGPPITGKVISFDGMLIEVKEPAGDTCYVPVTSADVIRIDRVEKSAKAVDYEADLPAKGVEEHD